MKFFSWGFPLLFMMINFVLVSGLKNFAQGYNGIDHYSGNNSYWQYNNKPVLLLGGSSEDNLFQIDDLESELDLINSCGGNYVRNTMSSRDSGNVWAFGKDEKSGKYNLELWNYEYWNRFERFLKLTSERNIIVQIELWATFDFYRDNWNINPFNPKNNINYSFERTKIDTLIDTHPIFCDNRFFWSIPFHDNNMPVLKYQQKYVDKLLSYSLNFNNILYCIDNETSVTSEWGRFWSDYIRKKAKEKGRKIHVTEMWDPHDLNHISHRETFDNPDIYSFVEISQNNHQKGEDHWNNGLKQLKRLQDPKLKRPVNNVKTYGNDLGRHGHGSQNGKESFVRSIFFGSASSRFHRTNSGLGINKEAQTIIKSLRKVTESIDFFESKIGNHLLQNREENEAYCRFTDKKDFIIFFTDGGEVELELTIGNYHLKWLEAETASWTNESTIISSGKINLAAPDKGLWFAVISLQE
jgi:hypothetical protein